MKIRGMNTAHVVSTELSIGAMTSPVPDSTAVRRSSPLFQRAVMLSMSTMELSTIIPTPRMSPDRDMMLIVRPASPKTSIEKTRAAGMVRATKAGDRKSFMNRKMIRHVRRTATTMFWKRLLMEYSRSSVWSLVSVKSTCG